MCCAVGGAVGLGVCAVRPGMCAVGMHSGQKRIESSFHISQSVLFRSNLYPKIAMDP